MTDKKDDRPDWPSRFGELGEKIFGKDDPFNDLRHKRALDLFSSDEMPPTRNPLNPRQIFTSKSKLRAVYKAAGVEEVGTEYENGYRPEQKREKNFERFLEKVGDKFKDRIRHG